MSKRLLLFILIVLFSFSIIGCGDKRTVVDKPEEVTVNKTESIDLDVYIDGTASMAGYVNYPVTTVYADALKNIERTVAGAWKTENIQYIKFGDNFQTLNREQFLMADKPVFYDQINTNLQEVVENSDNNKMSIIVTDLFQTNQDIESLMLAIKRKSFANADKAVGIIGLKSQFNGTIYDIGKTLASTNYTSNEDTKSYRPFFLLILGKEADVRLFIDDYKKNYKNDDQIKVALYSKNIGIDNVVEQVTTSNSNTNKGEKFKLMAKISNLVDDSNVLQFRFNLEDQKSKVDLVLHSKGVLIKDDEKYYIKVEKVEKWTPAAVLEKKDSNLLDKITGKGEKASKTSYSFEEINIKDFINGTVEEIEVDNTNADIKFNLKFDPLGVNKREGIYRIKYAIIPDKNSYTDIDVFEDWDVEDSEIGNEISLQEIGGKTLNISNFNKMLANLNYQINKPGFYNLYIYLDAKK